MYKWLGPKKTLNSTCGHADPIEISREVTDDPLAAIDPTRKGQKIYSVSRVNPLYNDNLNALPLKSEPQKGILRHSPSGEKSSSSGYGGSHGEGSSHEPVYTDRKRLKSEMLSVLEQNASYAKSIHVANSVRKKSVPSLGSGSSGAGTLSTIPEGKVDCSIPKPIWPRINDINTLNHKENSYDSLVDDALLLYTSFNYVPTKDQSLSEDGVSLKEILLELSNCINATIDGKTEISSEEMLKAIKEKISLSLEVLKTSREEEMRNLCVNLSNRDSVNSVIRAFSNSSSSGHSSNSSPEFNTRVRTISGDTTEEIYNLPSNSSSSGFSDAVKPYMVSKRFSLIDDLANINQTNMRNAIIYGTLCRANGKSCGANEKLLRKNHKVCEEIQPKKSLLEASDDSKPSVWQQYYGVNLAKDGEVKYSAKSTDVPLYPGGRPEADFTLDVPRSELLSKKMKENKKWRCRCRLLTSFLGLVFFLLSVMAVSLMLTRGKRMFGSMA